MASSEHAALWLAGDVAQELGRFAEGGSNLDQLARRWRGRGVLGTGVTSPAVDSLRAVHTSSAAATSRAS